MPIAGDTLKRRRLLLGFSQADLAIIAGVSEITVGRIEREQAPNGGGNISIDVVSRLCLALQLELHELIVPPTGNRYERAVRFAHQEQSPLAAPHLHDRSRSVKAQGLRRMTGQRTAHDEIILAREEEPTINGQPVSEITQEQLDSPEAMPAHTDGWNFADESSE